MSACTYSFRALDAYAGVLLDEVEVVLGERLEFTWRSGG